MAILMQMVELLVVVLGTFVVYLSAKGYLKSKDRGMLFMSIGFAFLVLSTTVSEILIEGLGWDLQEMRAAQDLLALVGWIAILYAIYGVRKSKRLPASQKRSLTRATAI